MDERGKWLMEEGIKYEARQRARAAAAPLVRCLLRAAGIGFLICVVLLLVR